MGIDKHNPDMPAQGVTQEKMYEAYVDYLHFNEVIGISNVGQLNKAVELSRTSELINVAEALHDKKIAAIVAGLVARSAVAVHKIIVERNHLRLQQVCHKIDSQPLRGCCLSRR